MTILIGPRDFQQFLHDRGHYRGQIDGLIGSKSRAAARSFLAQYGQDNSTKWHGQTGAWSDARVAIAVQQIMLKGLGFYPGAVDGFDGPNTQYAVELWQNRQRDIDPPGWATGQARTIWPRYSEIEDFYGPIGQNQERFTLPYPMRLAWDLDTTITTMTLHEKCGDSAMRVLEGVRDHYGPDAIRSLRLDLFGGSLNVRNMRGGGRPSTHSWGVAIDFDPERNQFRWGADRASLDSPEYGPFWDMWEAEGWVSLGRERNFDWMHVQAVRL